MKIKIAFLLLSVALFSCTPQKNTEYTIQGVISGLKSGPVLLLKQVERKFVPIDSAEIKNEQFTFKGSVKLPELYAIQISDTLDMIKFFIENAEILVNANITSIKDAEIKGSKTHDVFKSYEIDVKEKQQITDDYENKWYEASQANDKAKSAYYDSLYQIAEADLKEATKIWVKNNANSVAAVYITLRRLAYQMDFKEMEELVSSFDKAFEQSDYVLMLKKRIEILKSVAIGNTAPLFTMADTNGNPVNLELFKDKIVLLDFWASWCPTCRADNPLLTEVYNKIKEDKDIVFIGVSLDKKRDNWLKVVNSDNLTWLHVSDLKGWDNEAAKLYGINSIPTTFVLDKGLKIAYKNIKGDELLKKIKELKQKKS